MCNTADISDNGLYFETSLGHYYEGMNVSLARNFPPAGQTHHEETAKIVRTERLSDGKWGLLFAFFKSFALSYARATPRSPSNVLTHRMNSCPRSCPDIPITLKLTCATVN